MKFKDVFSIIGPAMVGPSSSHTAGAVRLGRIAGQLLGELPEKADITFYGSFAETYQGHGTDIAIAGGLLHYDTDDERIPNSLNIAKNKGINMTFSNETGSRLHPNTARLCLSSASRHLNVTGSSIGGGNVQIVNINGFDVSFTGLYPTLVITYRDRPGMVAEISGLLWDKQVNISHMEVDRKGRSGEAMMVMEIDNHLPEEVISKIGRISGTESVRKMDITKEVLS
ncbi:L-serine ammonia-lyase, iron-sulfur-dependent subunit beta [Salibacterium halotolerans]|uniref:L-serine deaminase n=1 Tax=Salibacterium halotolerans TaxID=1884432 RepID=A0A1I5S7T1_9BACI|nr:L-serine ammonia-lyase, iron-sulfur-dependent subunit beta [Salibacterium halotolerans]SFP66775.1 L-serine dehydratase [Salibacterium halotolerans]